MPVEALFDRDVAHEVAFRNLLQRHGYAGLDEVRAEGMEEGREQGCREAREILRELLRNTLRARGALTAEHDARIAASTDLGQLAGWMATAASGALPSVSES